MNKRISLILALATVLLIGGDAAAQTSTPWGYNTGYGNVYGTYGLAQTMQSMYNVARAQSRTRAQGQPSPSGASQPAERPAAPSVVRDHGKYTPDLRVDNATTFANALGDTPEERALVKQIFTATKAAFDKEAAARGWNNNIAAGLTFFTVAAINSYHDAGEPSDEAAAAFFKLINATLDEIPELGRASNKDKQGFNDMAVGFAGLLVAGYVEAKQNNDAASLALNKKLAEMMIQMILKTDPQNVRLENGSIVIR
jgi:hypothetical protein